MVSGNGLDHRARRPGTGLGVWGVREAPLPRAIPAGSSLHGWAFGAMFKSLPNLRSPGATLSASCGSLAVSCPRLRVLG